MKKLEKTAPSGKGMQLYGVFTALVAGFISGFFGAGGGAILLILSARKGGDKKDIFARTSAVTAVFSAISALGYMRKGNIPLNTLAFLAIPALAGGWIGARLLDRIGTDTLRVIFGIVSAVGGVIMLIR